MPIYVHKYIELLLYSSFFIFLALDTTICMPIFKKIPLRRKLWQILFAYSRIPISAYTYVCVWPWARALTHSRIGEFSQWKMNTYVVHTYV